MIKREQIDKLNQLHQIEQTLSPDEGYMYRELQPGECFIRKYSVVSNLDKKSENASLYKVAADQRQYCLKIFRNCHRGSSIIRSFLQKKDAQNVMPLIDYGKAFSHEYEVYPYYPEGSLNDQGEVPPDKLIRDVIPSINEALHGIHREGIVHLDIKPANLFWTDYHRRVIVGDFGISKLQGEKITIDKNGLGSVCYSPFLLEKGAVIDCRDDYVSFGLTIYTLLTGKPLFQALSNEEIYSVWSKGACCPKSIPQHFRRVIEGLINADIQKRWGYIDVRRWCEQQKNIGAERLQAEKKRALLFGRINGKFLTVETLEELYSAICDNWEQAKTVVQRRELIDFLQQFDGRLASEVTKLQRLSDLDASVFKLVSALDPEKTELVYQDKCYPTIADYISALSSGGDSVAERILSTGLFVYFLREKGVDSDVVDSLEAFIKKNGCSNTKEITKICYAIQGKFSYSAFGKTIASLSDLTSALEGRPTEEIIQLTKDSRFLAWLSAIGYDEEAKKLEVWE